MKALIASDLHFEFHKDAGKAFVESLPDADVLVCAGDLCDARGICAALKLLASKYPHVVFTFGNHEFYYRSIPIVRHDVARIEKIVNEDDRYGQLHVLDNSTCTIEGQRFVGTTLWFRYEPGHALIARNMNDFHVILDFSSSVYEENERALAFLQETVTSDDVVVTHHLPAEASVSPRYVGHKLTTFFLCDVEEFIQERQPKIWVHGHTHDSCDYVIGTTQVLCNPFGYVGAGINPAFNDELFVEL
jgi:Icc-related predicted phosphoesterase